MIKKHETSFLASIHSDYLPFVDIASAEDIGMFIKAQICLAKGEPVPELNGMPKALLDTHMALMERLSDTRQKKSDAGKKGGNPNLIKSEVKQSQSEVKHEQIGDKTTKIKPQAEVKQRLSNDKSEVKQSPSTDKPKIKPDTVTDTVTIQGNGGVRSRDAPPPPTTTPTLKIIIDFCNKRKIKINPERFFNHYDVAEWKDKHGNCIIKNWKKKIVEWERYEHKGGNGDVNMGRSSGSNPEERFADTNRL